MPFESSIVFFDSYCGFCWKSMLFIAARDPYPYRFFFVPLGGKTARNYDVAPAMSENAHAICLRAPDGHIFQGMNAIFHILIQLHNPFWKILGRIGIFFYPIFSFLFEALYNFIAVKRKAGGLFDCPMPEKAVRDLVRDRYLS